MSVAAAGNVGDGASEAAGLAGSVGEDGASELRDDPSAAASRLLPPGPASPAASHAPFPLTLRAAIEADLDAIWAIESAVFGAEAWSRDLMREELTAELRCYLALVDAAGAIVGYGGLLAVGSEGDIQTIAPVSYTHLDVYKRQVHTLHIADPDAMHELGVRLGRGLSARELVI